MSLQNLLKVGQLEEHETDAIQVRRMLQSAARSIVDARQGLLAIGANDWEPSVDYPPLRIVRFRSPYLEYGVEHHVISDIDIPIYSISKSQADAFRSRRFVDRSVAIECLRNALEERKATPAAIAQAARDCGAWKQMQPYLEAMTANG